MKKYYSKCLYFVIVLTVLGISIGYSAFSERMLIEGVVADVRVEKDIRITNVSIEAVEGGALAKYADYNTTNISSSITLPNELSTITYRIEVTNLGNIEMGLKDIKGLPENLDYEIINYNLEEKLCDSNKCSLGIKKEILLKIKYKEFNSEQTNYNLILDFLFKPFHKVKYYNILNSEMYPSEVIDSKDLELDFSNLSFKNCKIKMDNVLLKENTDYIINNNKLTIFKVVGDIEIFINYEANLREIKKGEYFKEDEYFDKIVSVSFVDYIEKENFVKKYDVSLEKNGQVIAWLVLNDNNFYELYIGSNEIIEAPNLNGFFQDMLIEEVSFSNLSFDKTTSFENMFSNCSNLKMVDLASSKIESVLSFEGMFSNCTSLNKLDLSNVVWNKNINISNMFYDCFNLESLNLGDFSIEFTNYKNVFTGVNNNLIIDINNKEARDWILSLSNLERPEVWSEVNFNIKKKEA